MNNLVLGGSLLALLLNTVTLVGAIWKGGRWSQKIEDKQERQDEILDRIATQLDAVERRVGSLEGRRT